MTLVGNTTPAANTDEFNANAKLAIRVTPVLGTIVRGYAYLDGNGTGTGNADCRFVVYSDTAAAPDVLLGVSSDVTVVDGQAFAFVQFPFTTPIVLASTAPIWIGIHMGTPQTIEAKRAAGGTAAAQVPAADTFSDGSATPFGAFSVPSQQLYTFYVDVVDYAPFIPHRMPLGV